MANHPNRFKKYWVKRHTYRGINIVEEYERGPFGHHTFDVWHSDVVRRIDDAPITFASLKGAKAAIDAALDK